MRGLGKQERASVLVGVGSENSHAEFIAIVLLHKLLVVLRLPQNNTRVCHGQGSATYQMQSVKHFKFYTTDHLRKVHTDFHLMFS